MSSPRVLHPTNRFAQIDGLRFVAILLVMLHHYLPDQKLPIFGHGVVLFFVLSGFFATRQLLSAKRHVSAGEMRTRTAILRFHVRRYLRIFPIYYIVVLGAILAGLPYAREAAWWHLTFTSNWYVLTHLEWMGPFSPFWSLALLEQFYWFWPTLFVLLPRRFEVAACVVLVVAGILWRGYCHGALLPGMWWLVFPVAGVDQLALGALVAVAHERGRESLRVALRRLGLWIAGPIAVAVVFYVSRYSDDAVHYVYQPTLVALVFVWLTDAASLGLRGWGGKLLALPVMQFGGRMSYGLFAVHEFTAYLIPPLLRPELPEALNHGWRPWVLIAATCALAAVLYRYVETPILGLKHSLDQYLGRRRAIPVAPGSAAAGEVSARVGTTTPSPPPGASE